MAKDITPELLDSIRKDFKKSFNSSKEIKRIHALLEKGEATYADAHFYSEEIGKMLSSSLQKFIHKDILPDGRMYYNIAERIFNDTLGTNYDLISALTTEAQKLINSQVGLGLKAIQPPINQSRIDGGVDKISAAQDFDDVAWLLGEPVNNFSMAIVDEFAKVNAEFQSDAGLKPKIVRRSFGDCCAWCDNLSGEYEYPHNVPDDVYKRHRECNCTVEFVLGDKKGKKDVWTKEWRR